MYFIATIFFMYIMTVIGYPASRFLIEIEEPPIGALLTKDVMIKDDIQTHYENLLDEVISTHNEDFLLKMTYSMTGEKMESFYRPQANMLLKTKGNPQPEIHSKCLYRMPHWVGKYLHDTHSMTYNNVAPMVQNYMEDHWPSTRHQQEMTLSDIKTFLIQLNQHLESRIEQSMMDPTALLTDLSLKLQLCQQQYDTKSSFLSRVLVQIVGDSHGMNTRTFSSDDLVDGDVKDHFLVNYLMAMRVDLATQMDNRMMDLEQLIHDDLEDDFVEY
ncbi:hypothetical protein BCR42DRAFT_491236 [Absidia repens]|uniref:Uncharacterized protein n=1 Tax=Absidia repens TaxID=90262 RepID=A0A1X2IIZ3_9FUNG|nr:hypothetical protein BCR42DRAFT_491236 [Absidia repens]